MKAFLVNLALCCSFTSSPHETVDSRTVRVPVEKPARVGCIFIIGNQRTQMSVILNQVGLYPGQTFSKQQIYRAEMKLTRLGIFKFSPIDGIRPTIEARANLQNPDSEFKDIYIHVEEDDTGRASLKHGLNAKGDWVLQLAVEERNLDPWRLPTSIADFKDGEAFRGAGLAIGVDFQLTVPLSPICKPFVTLTGKWPVSLGR